MSDDKSFLRFSPVKIIQLKTEKGISEAWIQKILAENPNLLGLGNSLTTRDKERPVQGGGRLDLLLQEDGDSKIRYEIEIQLGATDASHIMRTIEYWDRERKRYPSYDHIAVIVAEEITSRFYNVINLFNSAIPLIALKMTAIRNSDGSISLLFTKVLDLVDQSTDEDDAPMEQTTREVWLKKSSDTVLKNIDSIFEIIRKFEPNAELRYNKYYLGIWVDGRSYNFVTFTPKKKFFHLDLKLDRSEGNDSKLEQAGIEVYDYWLKSGRYHLSLDSLPSKEGLEILSTLLEQSYKEY